MHNQTIRSHRVQTVDTLLFLVTRTLFPSTIIEFQYFHTRSPETSSLATISTPPLCLMYSLGQVRNTLRLRWVHNLEFYHPGFVKLLVG